MTKFNFLNFITIITVACFLGAIFFGAMVSWPRFQEMKKDRENIISLKQALEQRETYFLALKKDKDRLGGYQKQLNKITSALPDDAELNLPCLFRFIQRASAETGLILTEIGPFTISPLEQKPWIKKTQFDFQVKGSYASFKAFLVRLERSARIIKVENISFSSPKEGELFTFDITISVHSY